MKIYVSDKLGSIFWLDENKNLIQAPLNSKDGTLINLDSSEHASVNFFNCEDKEEMKEIAEWVK